MSGFIYQIRCESFVCMPKNLMDKNHSKAIFKMDGLPSDFWLWRMPKSKLTKFEQNYSLEGWLAKWGVDNAREMSHHWIQRTCMLQSELTVWDDDEKVMAAPCKMTCTTDTKNTTHKEMDAAAYHYRNWIAYHLSGGWSLTSDRDSIYLSTMHNTVFSFYLSLSLSLTIDETKKRAARTICTNMYVFEKLDRNVQWPLNFRSAANVYRFHIQHRTHT